MKLSNETIGILKNFSDIEKTMFIDKGSIIETRSGGIYATAKVDEQFPVAIRIYDMPQFLGVTSLFEDPEYQFDAKQVTIAEGNNEIVYRYASPDLVRPLEKLPPKEITHTVKITSEELVKTIKAARIIGAEHIFVEATGEKVVLIAKNKQTLNHQFTMELGACDFRKFSFPVKVDRFMMITKEDYLIGFSNIRAVNFSTTKLSYWLAADAE